MLNKHIRKCIHRVIPFNRVIKVLIVSDFFLLFGWGLVMPILAVFITQSIKGGDVRVAGIAVGIYWLGKSLMQIPVAKYLDKNHGEKDDYYALIAGTLLACFVPLGFIFAFLPWHMYVLQSVYALAMAFAVPAWGGIFIRHIDKGKEALTWGTESSFVGIASGLAGIIGGSIAKIFGFVPLFVSISVLGIIASLLFLLLARNLLPRGKVCPIPKPY